MYGVTFSMGHMSGGRNSPYDACWETLNQVDQLVQTPGLDTKEDRLRAQICKLKVLCHGRG